MDSDVKCSALSERVNGDIPSVMLPIHAKIPTPMLNADTTKPKLLLQKRV